MLTNLSNDDINFFLGFQFLEDEKYIQNNILKFNSLDLDNSNDINLDLFLNKIDDLFKKYIKDYIINNKISNLGILLSGGIDSFLLLFYIRKLFPSLTINTFTFSTRKLSDFEEKNFEKLSIKFNTIHKNIIKKIIFIDIINEIKFIYSNSINLIGDEGLLFNSIFLKELKKITDIDTYITGDGIDVLFGGMSMYRLSYLENLNLEEILDSNYFIDNYQKIYFKKNILKYDKSFFYKFGEYFGGEFLGENNYLLINKFNNYFNNISNKYKSNISKQIVFNSIFLIGNRKNYIYESGKINNLNILSPFVEDSFIENILKLSIPDELLINKTNTKIIIRELASKIKIENGIDFVFIDAFKIDYYNEFNKNAKYIIYISKFLLDNGYIKKDYYKLVPNFIKNSMWYENKIRIYLLLNLYFFIKFNI